MDMAMVNAAQQVMNLQAGGLQDMQALQGMQGGLNGLFAQLFAQLLGQTEDGTMAEDPMLGTLLSSMANGETDDTQLNLAMQLMAGTMLEPQTLELLLGQTGDAAAVQAVLSAQEQQASPLWQLLAAQPEAAQQAVQDNADETQDPVWDALLDTLTAAWETHEDGKGLTAAAQQLDQMQFASAVRQVREQISERPREAKEETRQPLDIEALQAAVDSRQFVSEGVSARQEAPALQEIADQLKTGILENVRQGKNEFVVKLKPEGLGEITVKLTESKDEIALRIVTSSTAVGKMIANEVNALQNALRPLRAQVQEIVTVPAAQESAAQTVLTGERQGEQQFAWHYRQQEQHGGTNREKDGDGAFDALVEEIAPDDTSVNVLI